MEKPVAYSRHIPCAPNGQCHKLGFEFELELKLKTLRMAIVESCINARKGRLSCLSDHLIHLSNRLPPLTTIRADKAQTISVFPPECEHCSWHLLVYADWH